MEIDTINYKTLKKMVNENRNDADLGGAIRKLYWNFKENNDGKDLGVR